MASPAPIPGRATPEGTARYARAHPAAEGHYRAFRGLSLSSLGLGSYLGEVSPAANRAYEEAALAALEGGVNVLDAAINYRDQQSERDLGRALARWGRRDEVLVATKGGFIPFDSAARGNPQEYFYREYVAPGVLDPRDVAGGVHAMTPRFLANQLDRSLRNLGLEAVDVYFLHNPETQLASGVPPREFENRLHAVFAELERQCDAGRVGLYGAATWNGFLTPEGRGPHLALEKMLGVAADARAAVGGDPAGHHFGAIELPVNLAMPEAATAATQTWRGRPVPVLAAAREAGLLVLASASLFQTRLLGRIEPSLRTDLGAEGDLEAAIEFSRSVPGVTSALVGMGRPEHARENAAAMTRKPGRPEAVAKLLGLRK